METKRPAETDGGASVRRYSRAELLEAATEHLLDIGIAQLPLHPDATALDIPYSSLLHYFGSKDQLIDEVLEHLRVRNIEILETHPDALSMPTEQLLRFNWQDVCQPGGHREFLLLFELVALNARKPGRFEAQTKGFVDDFLTPIEKNLEHNGWDPVEARQLASTILALFRGLHLDLAMTGDQRRVDQALYRFIDMVTASH